MDRDNPMRRRREAALWRLERDLAKLQKAVLAQDGGASQNQVRDMDRMKREIETLKDRV